MSPRSAAASRAALPWRRNLALATAFLLLDAWWWIGLPLALPALPALGWTLLPLVLLTTTRWALMHEGIHAVLHPDRRWNDALSRALAMGFPAPFALLRYGHLKHHQYNRTELDRSEVYDPARQSWWQAAAGYYPQLLIGLYASEVAALLLVWLPRPLLLRMARSLPQAAAHPAVADSVERQLLRPEVLQGMRGDAALSLLLIGASLALYGAQAWMLGLALLGRGLLISLSDNVYHYATPLHTLGADVRGAINLALPRWAQVGILHFNHHATHHLHPALPWTALPQASANEGRKPAADYLPTLLGQLRGPIASGRLDQRS